MIQVGQVIDKYELLERVGQGGMAVVYRGIDRTLKRTVAIKVLHKHLADYQEARDRFEREAQAVAKLRHENILEIFDYAAKSDDCYIVTEFIDGQTLKQFITERPIAYPEVGGMVMLQVCRALAHAHAGGILHRDIKPENIMIRSDGVVKLMDFGISHMVDLERLTVTGQLLGSPAYMSPEHVEGRQLDFRTDVFAVGIVLYQLTVGRLPFEGKNPHEVLKRIAECKFVDPRQANPRIGNRLGRIILRAMAAMPNDRYAAIGEMVLALEKYLEESGLPTDKVAAELARYFSSPASYENALKTRLVEHLTLRGRELLDAGNKAGALDVFDRVLTIDKDNAKVIAILDGLNRRAKLKHAGLVLLAAGVIGGSAFVMNEKLKVDPEAPEVAIDTPVSVGTRHDVVHEPAPPPPPDAADEVPAPNDAQPAVIVVAPKTDGGHAAEPGIDAASPPVAIALQVWPGSSYRIDKGPLKFADGGRFTVQVGDHPVDVEIENTCCEPVKLAVDRTMADQTVAMQLLPAAIVLTCKNKNASVTIDGKAGFIGDSFVITFDKNAMSSTKTVHVVYSDGQHNDAQTITVAAHDLKEVTCALP